MKDTSISDSYFIEKARESHVLLLGRIFIIEMIFLLIRRLFLSLKNFLGFALPELWMYWMIHLVNVTILIIVILYWINKETILTKNQVIISQGLFHFERDTYNIENIELIKTQNTFLGLLFGYTNIYMYAPTIKENIYIKGIAKNQARNFSDYIQQYISTSQKIKIINAQNN